MNTKKRHTLIIDGEENFSSLLNCLFIIQVCSTQHLLDVYSQTLVCMEKDGIKNPPIHASKWRQRAFERLLFLALISPIFSSKWTCCFYFHAPAEDREMRGGAVKTTMTRTIRRSCDFHYLAYHFKTVQQALHCGHLNQLSGLSSPALPNNLPWFCPIWISFPSLSHTVNNAFVVAPFPPFMSNI